MTNELDNPVTNPDEEHAPTYPASDEERIGVDTDQGTSPDETDQGDEEVEREQTDIPN